MTGVVWSMGRMDIAQATALAYRRWNDRQAPQAAELCRQILLAAPGQAAALHLLGLIAHGGGDAVAAIGYLTQACRAADAPPLYFSNLAEMLRQTGQLAPAELAARQALARDPALRQAWNNLGIILQEAGKLDESLTCLEHALGFEPENAELLNNLGNTLARLGRLDAAWGRYTQALRLNRHYAEAHSNLASVLNLLGRNEEALVHARNAALLNPRLPDAYVNAASILHAQGEHPAAMAELDRLFTIAPRHAKGFLLQAQCLEALQQSEAAIGICRQAATWHPENGDIQLALAKLLRANLETEAATVALEAAIARMRDPAEALTVAASFAMETGQIPVALAAVRDALQCNPKHANAWLTLSELKRFQRNDADILALRKLLGPDGLQTCQEQIQLNFALGKAYLDTAEPAKAFAHFDTGNRMKRTSIRFDLRQTEQWMRAVAGQFSAERMASVPKSALDDASAVFIVGMPRSGTTLVEQILASHPEISGAGELTSIQRQVDSLSSAGPGYPELAASLNPEQLHRFGAAHIVNLRRHSARRLVIDKMPSNFFYAGLIHLALPNARIIHLRRNAADACLSCYTKLFGGVQQFAYDLAELGGFHRAYQGLMAHWRETLPESRFHEVAYEDLVADFEGETRKLLEFCGVEWHAACARFFETEREVRTASAIQIRQPLYGTSIGRAARYREFLEPLFAALEG